MLFTQNYADCVNMLDSEFSIFVVSFFLLINIIEMANIYYYLYLKGNRALGD